MIKYVKDNYIILPFLLFCDYLRLLININNYF